jgi:hypothetical protein
MVKTKAIKEAQAWFKAELARLKYKCHTPGIRPKLRRVANVRRMYDIMTAALEEEK